MSKFLQYRVFAAVVESCGISSAARLLNYSPSAVSKQLTTLEDRINVQLVDRSNRTIKITDAGKKFYLHCKEILEKVADAEDNLLTSEQLISGKISFTISKSLARSSIFNTISEFSKQNSAVRYNIEFSDEVKDLYETNNGFAFRLGEVNDSSRLVAIPLFNVRLIFCAAPEYLERNGALDSFEDLSNHHLILLSPNNFSDEMRGFVKQNNISTNPESNHTTNDIEAVYQSVRSGQSIGMMLDVSVKHELENNIFVDVFPAKVLPSKNLYLVYKKSNMLSKRHEAFKTFIKGEYTKI